MLTAARAKLRGTARTPAPNARREVVDVTGNELAAAVAEEHAGGITPEAHRLGEEAERYLDTVLFFRATLPGRIEQDEAGVPRPTVPVQYRTEHDELAEKSLRELYGQPS